MSTSTPRGLGAEPEPTSGFERNALCNAELYAEFMSQLVTRIDDEMAAAIDALIASGEFASRSDVVREGVARLVDERRRRAIGEQIVAGYDRSPETPDELRQAEVAARAMIDDEPW